jgi:glutathione peroxidase
MFARIDVNGDNACELYQTLKAAQVDDDGKPDIAWNFTKFLVDREGNVVKRYAPQVGPEDIAGDLAQFL